MCLPSALTLALYEGINSRYIQKNMDEGRDQTSLKVAAEASCSCTQRSSEHLAFTPNL